MELKKQKGVHGFAIELVKFEPMFKNVFSYVFGDSLVVDDIEKYSSFLNKSLPEEFSDMKKKIYQKEII